MLIIHLQSTLQLPKFPQTVVESGWSWPSVHNPFIWSLILAMLGASVIALVLSLRWKQERACCGAVLRRMGRSLGLGSSQQRLIRTLARAGGIQTPASLLVSEGCFDHAASRYVIARGRNQAIDDLRRLVFDD